MTTSIQLSKSRKATNYILFVMFLLFAVIQLNDPDPLLWFIIYGIVASVFIFSNYRKISRIFIWSIVIWLLVYAGFHFSYFLDWLNIEDKNELFGEMVYDKPYLEGTREFLGLLIAAIALLFSLKK